LLGFAELVTDVPPIEEFLSPIEEAPVAIVEAVAPPEPPEPSTISEPPLEPVPPELAPGPPLPEPAPIRARVRDLPPAPTETLPSDRPQNLVGRLGRRPAEASPAPQPAATPPTPAPVDRHPAEPAPPAAYGAQNAMSAGGRGGRHGLPRNRRLYRRAKLPAEFEIGGVPCTLIDVSIGGFAATGVPPIEPNAIVPVTIRLTIDGIEVGTQLTGRIVYVTQGRSAGRFIDLSPSQMAFLRYIVTWRGESVGAVGTTTLLDAIAGGRERRLPPGFEEPPGDASKSRWWAGLIGRGVKPPR
jgi:hypothetical protein